MLRVSRPSAFVFCMMAIGGLAALGLVVAIGSSLVAGPPPVPEDIVKGTGPVVQPGDLVTVNFVVSTPDGKEAANTFKRGLPYTFVLGDPKMPPMWMEGLAGMNEGGERKFVAGPDKAYGAGGVPPIVPGGATLAVHVWVLKVRR